MNDATVFSFYRAAGQRIAAARVLLTVAETLDATYLGGYGIECSLKAIILSFTPSPRRQEVVMESFRGQAAHNLDWLLFQTHSRGCNLPLELLKRIRRCIPIWYVDLRYQSGRLRAKDCRYVIETAEQIWSWTGKQIP
ncbi:HEPN domain-containing protein [bacterium]|nr:HEPN domain-containing protein [bacterium]